MFREARSRVAKPRETQRSQPWVHGAFCPCGTRAALAATNVAAKPVDTENSSRYLNLLFSPQYSQSGADEFG